MITGVYEIRNLIDGKAYIGSSKDVKERWDVHNRLLKTGKHHSKHLQNAVKKYGIENFQFRILFQCELKDLIFFEQRAIDTYKAFPEGYNSRPRAESCLGHKQTLEHIKKRSEARIGKKMSKEAIENRTNSRRKNGNFIYSEEYKEKMAESMKKRYESDEARKQTSDGFRKFVETNPEAKKILSDRTKKRYESQEEREKSREHLKKVRPDKKGRSYEEMYGLEKANEIRSRISKGNSERKLQRLEKQIQSSVKNEE